MKYIPQEHSYAITAKNNILTIFEGKIHKCSSLDEVEKLNNQTNHELVFLNPYSSIHEKGFQTFGEDPIITLEVLKKHTIQSKDFLKEIENHAFSLEETFEPNISDEAFTQLVSEVQRNEIEAGNATQIILSRIFRGKLKNISEDIIVSIFKKLLEVSGQYMTFLFVDRSEEHPHYFLGASPERHLEITQDAIILNPIAGTLPKQDKKTFRDRLNTFLEDKKEINELFQVLDEELKMMARICPEGGKITGPFLREIGAVIHTEYHLEGHRGADPIPALRETLHAPTLVGGPLESAARIIAKYEKESRRYYAGELCILKKDNTFDSAILIRSAEIDYKGNIRVQAGAGIVRDSVPEKEMEETKAKSKGLIDILKGKTHDIYLQKEIIESVQEKLTKRNEGLSRFLLDDQSALHKVPEIEGLKVSIINNEDNFAYMIGHILKHMGAKYELYDTFEYDVKKDSSDLVIIGPGPGDINDQHSKRMERLNTIVQKLFDVKKPCMGICLGHQAICKHLGFPVSQQITSTQGMQRSLIVFENFERLGFYNSFSPLPQEQRPSDIAIDTDENNRIMTISGPHFIGCQFHLESVMSEHGYNIFGKCLKALR